MNKPMRSNLTACVILLVELGLIVGGGMALDDLTGSPEHQIYRAKQVWQRPMTICGQVVDQQGQPIPGAVIAIERYRANWWHQFGAGDEQATARLKRVTGKDGLFLVDKEWAMALRVLLITAPGYRDVPIDRLGPAGRVLNPGPGPAFPGQTSGPGNPAQVVMIRDNGSKPNGR